MARRRMFSLDIIDTDFFMDMPVTTQNLYFHLAMRGDDDGFIGSPKKIMKLLGANDDDLKILIAKKFVIIFESGICVITHWKHHNYIQADRYKETIHIQDKKLLDIIDGTYTECIQNGYKSDTQVRLELGKDRIELGKGKEDTQDFSSFPPVQISNNKNQNSDAMTRIETIRAHWNGQPGLPKYRFMAISMRQDDLSGALRTLGAYSDDEIKKAIDNYNTISTDGEYTPFPVYSTFAGFLKTGPENYGDDSNPFDRCRKRTGPKEQTVEEYKAKFYPEEFEQEETEGEA